MCVLSPEPSPNEREGFSSPAATIEGGKGEILSRFIPGTEISLRFPYWIPLWQEGIVKHKAQEA